MPTERRLSAILAADVVGYSRLMRRDEAGTLAALNAHRKELVDVSIAEHHGRIVKVTGDGILIEFPSVVNAVACAVVIQQGMYARNQGVDPVHRIEFRIGINLGDVIVEGDDIYGDGVNVAARIEAIAKAGGISVSGAVREHIDNRLNLDFTDVGEQRLKNIDRPIRIFEIPIVGSHAVSTTEPTGSAPSTETRPTIAVLPFTNMSGDPEQEYFSDGITEDIITDLSKISGLFVVGRNTSFTFKGKSVNLLHAAAEMRVRYLLEGSIRKAGQRVRINAQLVDGRDGGHVWAERYDRDLTDIFEIQDEITHMIVDQLKVHLLPSEKAAIEQAPTASVEAYTYYLRGREFFHRGSRTDFVLAKRMFERAIEIDPLYARAYAGIADCDSFLVLVYEEDISIDDILRNSEKALDLESGLGEAHASRGLAFSVARRYADAEAEFEQAISCNPNLFEAHYFFARTCFAQGKLSNAAELYERAASLKPDDYQAVILVTGVYHSLGRFDDERHAAHRGAELAKREMARDPRNARAAYLGAQALLILGEHDQAREWASRARAIDPHDILTQYNLACIHCTLGDHETAFDLLESLLPSANHESRAWVLHDSDLDPLHEHPRWQKILTLVNAPPA